MRSRCWELRVAGVILAGVGIIETLHCYVAHGPFIWPAVLALGALFFAVMPDDAVLA